MLHDFDFITVSYQDDLVFCQDQVLPSGSLLILLLNHFREHNKIDNPTQYLQCLSEIQDHMKHGKCDKAEFENARSIIMSILEYLPAEPIFSTEDLEDERSDIQYLLSEESRLRILSYYQNKPELSKLQYISNPEPRAYYRYNELRHQEHTYLEALKVFEFFERLDFDIRSSYDQIQEFTRRLPSLTRLDEIHMLPEAVEIFGLHELRYTTEYIPIRKTSRSKSTTIARQVHFDNIMSFILTDFYEGLHHGHYPQLCPICGKLFLMTSARRQVYCDGLSPHTLRGKRLSCRKYAAAIGRRELAENDPVTDLYNRRCAAIRTEKSRKTIPSEFAEAAIKLAKEHKLKALQDESYAHKQYELDMARDKLYADTKERLK